MKPEYNMNKKIIIKTIIFLLLGYVLCVAVTYFLDDKIFRWLGYDIIGAGGRYVISDPMKYHNSALLLLILWELKKLNAKFKNDSDAEDE